MLTCGSCVVAQLEAAGVAVRAVGLGEPEKARKFAELLQFPEQLLYAGTLSTAPLGVLGGQCCAVPVHLFECGERPPIVLLTRVGAV
jgi:hypothetical protein